MTSADLGKDPNEVSAMFDKVAPAYDKMNTLLSLGASSLWRIAMVRALSLTAGDRVLDIAAGTGTSSAAIARTGARVTALDFSAGMVEVGRERHPDMKRVLAPGGRLVVCEFTTPPNSVVKGGYMLYLTKVMPELAKLASTNPEAYTYLAQSIEDWPDQGVLSGWLREAGFTDVGYRNLTAGVVALHRGRVPLGADA